MWVVSVKVFLYKSIYSLPNAVDIIVQKLIMLDPFLGYLVTDYARPVILLLL